jgi:hypothetical protein
VSAFQSTSADFDLRAVAIMCQPFNQPGRGSCQHLAPGLAPVAHNPEVAPVLKSRHRAELLHPLEGPNEKLAMLKNQASHYRKTIKYAK